MFGDSHTLEIYVNEELQRHSSENLLRISIPGPQSPMSYCVPEDVTSAIMPPLTHIELRKARCAIHLSYEALENLFNINLNSSNTFRNRDVITTYLRVASRETVNHLKEMQPVEEGHPVILNSVRLFKQEMSRLFLIELEFWSITIREAELGRSVFERILHELVQRGLQDFNSETQINLDTLRAMCEDSLYGSFDTKKYSIDAEENAHELLKSMITDKQFELYKKENFVEVKGTHGRTYKVIKGSMIQIIQRIKGQKKKVYDLCLEPRDRGTICPTDEVIAKIRLIRADEKKLHKIGNTFNKDGTFNTGINHLSINFTLGGRWQKHDAQINDNTFNIMSPGIEKADNIQIYLNGVLLEKGEDFTINDSTIVFNKE